MTRFDPKAILIALLLSLALDFVGGTLLVASFSSGLIEGMSPEQLEASIRATMQSDGFLLASVLFGTATTVIGGYAAAHLARAYPYFNAFAVGVIGIVLGLVLGGDTPWWFDAVAYVLSVPAAVLGAYLRQQRNQ
jgi:hypothetical protein